MPLLSVQVAKKRKVAPGSHRGSSVLVNFIYYNQHTCAAHTRTRGHAPWGSTDDATRRLHRPDQSAHRTTQIPSSGPHVVLAAPSTLRGGARERHTPISATGATSVFRLRRTAVGATCHAGEVKSRFCSFTASLFHENLFPLSKNMVLPSDWLRLGRSLQPRIVHGALAMGEPGADSRGDCGGIQPHYILG